VATQDYSTSSVRLTFPRLNHHRRLWFSATRAGVRLMASRNRGRTKIAQDKFIIPMLWYSMSMSESLCFTTSPANRIVDHVIGNHWYAAQPPRLSLTRLGRLRSTTATYPWSLVPDTRNGTAPYTADHLLTCAGYDHTVCMPRNISNSKGSQDPRGELATHLHR
jgi:hypothetical protein